MIRLHVCAGWSEALLVAHTTLVEISCTGSSHQVDKEVNEFFSESLLLLLYERENNFVKFSQILNHSFLLATTMKSMAQVRGLGY